MDDLRNKFNEIYTARCKQDYLPSILGPVDNIIVIGDIHGDMSVLLKCLRIPKLIDNNNNWIGKNTVVVQIGDQIDSCRFYGNKSTCNEPNYNPEDKAEDEQILYYLTELHNQASKVGGAVYSLMGNHEFMNVEGDMRFVSHSNIRSFDNYKHNGKIIQDGLEGRRSAFKPGNKIANFLACTRKMALIIGSNLFVHAGLIPIISKKYKVEEMNQLLALFLLGELEQPTLFKDLFTSVNTSPMWVRSLGKSPVSSDACNDLSQTLEIYQVGKMFIGHTPQAMGINETCNNSVWRTDIGMSRAFSGINKKPEIQVLQILYDNQVIILS